MVSNFQNGNFFWLFTVCNLNQKTEGRYKCLQVITPSGLEQGKGSLGALCPTPHVVLATGFCWPWHLPIQHLGISGLGELALLSALCVVCMLRLIHIVMSEEARGCVVCLLVLPSSIFIFPVCYHFGFSNTMCPKLILQTFLQLLRMTFLQSSNFKYFFFFPKYCSFTCHI